MIYGKKWHKKYYSENRKSLLKKRRIYYQTHKKKENARNIKYQQSHRKQKLADVKRWIKNNPKKHKLIQKRCMLKRKYGISLETYNRMFKEQKGKCAICKSPQRKFAYALAVDHNHKTGKIRMLLCTKCNSTLGWFEKYKNEILNYTRA